MVRPLYARLHSAFVAMKNCERMNNVEWLQRHGETIKGLVDDHMPSGSGWDCGTTYDLAEWSESKLVFRGSFHHMNDGGYYDGWTDHTITVLPSFDGIDIAISGRERNDIKDYLGTVFYDALRTEIDDAALIAASRDSRVVAD